MLERKSEPMPFIEDRTTEYLIDTHTHIAPGVDDGSSSMEMSLAMLRSEAEQGAKVVFLTPHSSAFGGTWTAYTLERMQEVQEAAAKEGLPIRICRGCEIYTERRQIEEILQDLKDGILPSMNGTRYVLAEFSTYRGNMDEAKYCLRRYLEEGWIPIIAHAERYCRTLATAENVKILKEMGCFVQLNFYDLAREPDDGIRSCAQALLQAELADMMGSDAHRMDHRRPELTSGADYIREHCRAEYAADVLWRNAAKLLLGEEAARAVR